MNIRLLRSYSVPKRISSPELHVSDTCLLHGINVMGRYVTTTYRPHKLHVCVLGGYVSTTYPQIWVIDYTMSWVFKSINNDSNSSWISLKCFQVSNSCLMDLTWAGTEELRQLLFKKTNIAQLRWQINGLKILTTKILQHTSNKATITEKVELVVFVTTSTNYKILILIVYKRPGKGSSKKLSFTLQSKYV